MSRIIVAMASGESRLPDARIAPPAAAARTGARPALRRVQRAGLGDRSDSDRPAVHRAGRSGGRRRSAPPRWRSAASPSVLQSIERLLAVMGDRSRRDYVRAVRSARAMAPRFAGIVHRWTRGRRPRRAALGAAADARPLGLDRGVLRRGPRRRTPPTSVRRSTASRARALALDLRAAYGRVPARPGVGYFFPRPSSGQRLQAAEPVPALDGPARRARPRRLDARVPRPSSSCRSTRTSSASGRCLRLTRYTSPGWKMARDITASLRAARPRRIR